VRFDATGFSTPMDCCPVGKTGLWRRGFRRQLELYATDSGSLGLLWQILPERLMNNDGFGVYYPSDESAIGVLAEWAAFAR
jgi:hypothetical protein